MTRPTWHQIADRLADRLANHAHCPEHGPTERNRDCPFCDDLMAYEEYLAAGGSDSRWVPTPGDKIISICDIPLTKGG